MFLGHLESELVIPFPRPAPWDDERAQELITRFLAWSKEYYDPRRVEEEGWIGDDTVAALGELGLLGLHVPTRYGGQGLSQTNTCRVSEEFGRVDATLAVVLGEHQSIGLKGIEMFGTPEQRERFLPDLARGKKLAAFALTEPTSGSDAYNLQTTAERRPDGSFRINGVKRWIGNANKDVITVFARYGDGHLAFIAEKGMPGLEVTQRFDTLGLRGNHLFGLRFNDLIIPPDNVLGEPGDGFRIAMAILNNGRLSLGAGCVGVAKKLLQLSSEHVQDREQFGQPLADFPLVQEKLGWMASYLYGLEAMTYLTTGLVDLGVSDSMLESAAVKVASTEFLWYAVNRAFQLAGGRAYMSSEPFEKILRDTRVFPIFEGSNDVLRCFIALEGLNTLSEELEGLRHLELSEPRASAGVLAHYLSERIRQRFAPDRIPAVNPNFQSEAQSLGEQVAAFRARCEQLLRRFGERVSHEQGAQKRIAESLMDMYAQLATLSRVTRSHQLGVETDEEILVSRTFCERAGRRVRNNLSYIEHSDDVAMHQIAREVLRAGRYPFVLGGRDGGNP